MEISPTIRGYLLVNDCLHKPANPFSNKYSYKPVNKCSLSADGDLNRRNRLLGQRGISAREWLFTST